MSINSSGKTRILKTPLLEDGAGGSSSEDSTDFEDLFPATIEEKQRKRKFKMPKWCRPFRCKRDHMSPEDRLNLNWVQKWVRFGRFPWKFIFHALLTAACTAMIFLQTSDQTSYVIATDASFYQIFYPPSFQYAGDYAENAFYFYNINDTIASVKYAVEQYVEFPNISVVPYRYVVPDEGVAGLLTVNSYVDCESVYNSENVNLDISINSTVYEVTPDYLGPFSQNLSDSDLRYMFYCMKDMWLTFAYENTHLQYDHPIDYLLEIGLLYDNSVQGGRISLKMFWARARISDLPYTKLLQLYKIMLDIAIIVTAMISQVLSWVSIGRSFQIFAAARRTLSQKKLQINSSSPSLDDDGTPTITWGSLPLRTKLRFFNLWFVVTILGNVANILAAFLDFFVSEDAENGQWERFLLGIGTMLAWINLVRYLEFDAKYTVLISALQRGFPSALRFFLGALPVFIGFALFGVSSFSEVSLRFSTFSMACVTLFGLQNGDDVQGTFNDTTGYLGFIYLVAFVFLSIYGITNIFIAIMDEAYTMSMMQSMQRERNAARPYRALHHNPLPTGRQDDDLTNDDALWDTILGLSVATQNPAKKKKSKRNAAGKAATDTDAAGSTTPVAVPDDQTTNTTDDVTTDFDDDDEDDVQRFMDYLDTQHAKFRTEIAATLKTFMQEKSARSRYASAAASLSTSPETIARRMRHARMNTSNSSVIGSSFAGASSSSASPPPPPPL